MLNFLVSRRKINFLRFRPWTCLLKWHSLPYLLLNKIVGLTFELWKLWACFFPYRMSPVGLYYSDCLVLSWLVPSWLWLSLWLCILVIVCKLVFIFTCWHSLDNISCCSQVFIWSFYDCNLSLRLCMFSSFFSIIYLLLYSLFMIGELGF